MFAPPPVKISPSCVPGCEAWTSNKWEQNLSESFARRGVRKERYELIGKNKYEIFIVKNGLSHKFPNFELMELMSIIHNKIQF